jgi:hypothetical protein
MEPNDTRATARPDWQPLMPLEICPGDEDWFLINLQAGQSVRAEMFFSNAVGDLDMAFFGPGGAQLSSSTSVSDTELITWAAQFAGAYRLRVYGFNGATGPYDLALEVVDGPLPCEDDFWEDNDDRQSASLWPPDFGPIDAALCPDDPDVYVFDAEGNTDYLAFLDYGGPPGMRLTISRPGQGVLGSSAMGGGFEEVEFTSDFAGPVYARVAGIPLADGSARPYFLDVFPLDAPCQPDSFEDNDSPQDSTLVVVPRALDATACAADPDFYAVLPGLAAELTVTLDADPGLGITATVLRLSDFTFLGFVNAGDGPTTFDIGPVPSEPITIIVGGQGEGAYTLSVD